MCVPDVVKFEPAERAGSSRGRDSFGAGGYDQVCGGSLPRPWRFRVAPAVRRACVKPPIKSNLRDQAGARRAANADLKLAVFDATALPELDAQTLAVVDDQTLVVLNKVDRAPNWFRRFAGNRPCMFPPARAEGLPELLRA